MTESIPFTLEPFCQSDYADYRSLTENPRVMEMVTGRALSEPESLARFENMLQQNKVAAGYGNFKILNQQSGEFMGLAKLVIEHPEDKEVEIGFILSEKYQRKGIASAATRQLIAFARQQKTVLRVKAILDPNNKASKKILLREGFVSQSVGDIDGLPGEVMVLVL